MKKGYSHLHTYTPVYHPIRHIIEAFGNAAADEDSNIAYFGDTEVQMWRCQDNRVNNGIPFYELRGAQSGAIYARFKKKRNGHIPMYALLNDGALHEKRDLLIYKR